MFPTTAHAKKALNALKSLGQLVSLVNKLFVLLTTVWGFVSDVISVSGSITSIT